METIERLYANIGNNDSTDIISAVMNNDCAYVISYFKRGLDINTIDARLENLLHKASRNDNYEVFDLLIRLGVDMNAKNRYLETPMHLAVQFKNYDIVNALILYNANINVPNKKGIYPIHLAALSGKEQILNCLIDNGAKTNVSDENGLKPIHYAVRSGKKEIIRCLLNNGASLMECDDRKNNVLHHACEKGKDELVSYILRHMVVSDTFNIYKETPLHLASVNCTTTTLNALINAGYDLQAKNANGQTPYDMALESGITENATFLQEARRGASYREHYLKYPLHRAVYNKQYTFLMENVNDTNINSFDYYGKTLLYYAITVGSLKIMKFLLERGARMNNVDELNQSALLIALYTENVPALKLLLELGADPNEIFYHRSYLYRAIIRNNYEVVEMLINYGADVNYTDNRHRNIYSYAIECATDDIIELLIKNKATLV